MIATKLDQEARWAAEFVFGATRVMVYDYIDESSQYKNILLDTSLTETESQNNANPMGIAESSTNSFSIASKDGSLRPSNLDGPFASYLIPGTKVNMYFSYDNYNTLIDCGKCQIVRVSDSYSQSSYDKVHFIIDDTLDSYLNKPLPNMTNLENITAEQLFNQLLPKLGLYDYYISDKIKHVVIQNIAVNTGNAQEFINLIIQYLNARVYIDRSGVVQILRYDEQRNGYNEITLGAADIGQIGVQTLSPVNYNKLEIRYLSLDGDGTKTVIDEDIDILNQLDVLNKKTSDSILSVDASFLDYKVDNNNNIISTMIDGDIRNINITNTLETSDKLISGARLTVYGTVAGNVEQTYIESLNDNDGITFSIDVNRTLSSSELDDFVNRIKLYLGNIAFEYVIPESGLNPEIQRGDIVNIAIGTSYDGRYKVVKSIIDKESSSYNHELTLIKIGMSGGV